MSNYDINANPALVKQIIENTKKAYEEYLAEHPDSLIPSFEQELRDRGFQFEISEQIKWFLHKHKKTILPIAIRFINKRHTIMRRTFLSVYFIIKVLKK